MQPDRIRLGSFVRWQNLALKFLTQQPAGERDVVLRL
jgi:hypothetical protein